MVAWVHALAGLLVLLPVCSDSFILFEPVAQRPRRRVGGCFVTRIGYSKNDQDSNNSNNNNNNDNDAIMLDELSWRAAKIRLEDAHTQGFLKRKPVKLRYRDARRWVQANLGAETKDEFKDMVANGNLRTPYIPKNPSTYYRETGDWISWDHFLTGYSGEEESGIQPCTGKFD